MGQVRLVLIGAILILGLVVFGPSEGDSSVAYNPENLVRLHVLAHSDSPEDQLLKMQVRDALLSESKNHLAKALTKEEALEIIGRERFRLEDMARARVSEAGFSYPVRLDLETKAFPERYYDGWYVPAGVYDAVTITIGDGEGSNWWCVMFPPLCLTDAVVEEAQEMDLHNLILPGRADVRTRFASVEWVRGLFTGLSQAMQGQD